VGIKLALVHWRSPWEMALTGCRISIPHYTRHCTRNKKTHCEVSCFDNDFNMVGREGIEPSTYW